jgi:flap endonuclease-1
MGIPKLNAYLMNNCSKQSIDKKHLSTFSGKTVVIDTSIYLYKFAAGNGIIESLFQMIKTFRYYNIKPIFIFDGKPPEEKKALIYKRNDLKDEAEIKHNAAESEYDVLSRKVVKTKSDIEKMATLKELVNTLRKQCVRVSWSDTEKARRLLTLCNVEYYNAEGEADELCVHMVLNKKAWACVSDDMDMFVYGCTRVMRGLSLFNHTVTFYNINGILRELDLHMTEFRRIAVLSGTDYNIDQRINISDTLKQFNIYKKLLNNNISFYDWFATLKNIDIDNDKLTNIYNMFCIANIHIPPKPISNVKKGMTMHEFLRPHGFVFA